MSDAIAWGKWRSFPNPGQEEYLFAPFGPGVYQLRRVSIDQDVYVGQSGNVAYRMSSLLPVTSGGCGGRKNRSLRDFVALHLQDIEYRTVACASKEDAAALEAHALSVHNCLFN